MLTWTAVAHWTATTFPAGQPDRATLSWDLPADTLRQAIDDARKHALNAARDDGYAGVTLLGLQVCPKDDLSAVKALIPPLIGYSRIALKGEVTRQRAQQLGAGRNGRPGQLGPVMAADGPLFLERAVDDYFAGSRQTGRPKKTAEGEKP